MAVRRFEGKNHVEAYKKYRPTFGDDLFTRIMEYARSGSGRDVEERYGVAVDVGCGSGQSTKGLVKYFEHIVGVDVSTAQIDQARATIHTDNVQFRVAEAENLPMKDESVDLITAGIALHWFDHSRFYHEVDRVLRPGGVIAAYAHSSEMDILDHPNREELTNLVADTKKKVYAGNRLPKQNELLQRRYADKEIQIPYSDSIRDDSMALHINGTIDSLFGHLTTLSTFNRYLKESGEAGPRFWTAFTNNFCDLYGSSDVQSPLHFKFDVFLIMGRKPTSI